MTEPATPSAPPPVALPGNWGRWGLDDERGTLNLVTAEARRRGVDLARIGRTVSLARPISTVPLAGGGPAAQGMYPMPSPIVQIMNYTGPSPALTDVLIVNSHHLGITHIDALAHISVDGLVYPGVPISQAAAGGTIRHGSTTAFADGITTRGVFLDLAPDSRLAPDHSVTAADLDEAAQRAGVQVESGDAVVVRAGWTVSGNAEESVPWFGLDAVRWLGEHDVALLAGDIGDRPPRPGGTLPLHEVALARLGLPLIDGAAVSALAATCSELQRWEFLFVVAPMPVRGCTGVPVNPLAVF
ncbi:cyclase family protein [Kribbella sp. NPDC055071]